MGIGEGGAAPDAVGVGSERAVGECDAYGAVGGVVEGAGGVHHGRGRRVRAAGGEEGLPRLSYSRAPETFQPDREMPSVVVMKPLLAV